MRLIAAGIAALALTVAACGDDDDQPTGTTEADTPASLEQRQASRYTTDYQVCDMVGRGVVEDDSGITVDPNTDPVTYAQAWSERYRPEFQQSSFEGCLNGLEGDPPKHPLP